MKKPRRPRLQGVSPQHLHERLLDVERRLTMLEETMDIVLGAMEELTLQSQFLLRTITDTREVVGILDVKPRKVTVRMLDIYRKRKPVIAKELEDERKAIQAARENAQREDEARLLAALEAAGIDPNDAAKVDEYINSLVAAEEAAAANTVRPAEAEQPNAG